MAKTPKSGGNAIDVYYVTVDVQKERVVDDKTVKLLEDLNAPAELVEAAKEFARESTDEAAHRTQG